MLREPTSNRFKSVPAPVASSSPPASSSPHRRTQPRALRLSQCSLPANRRGIAHCELLATLKIEKQFNGSDQS